MKQQTPKLTSDDLQRMLYENGENWTPRPHPVVPLPVARPHTTPPMATAPGITPYHGIRTAGRRTTRKKSKPTEQVKPVAQPLTSDDLQQMLYGTPASAPPRTDINAALRKMPEHQRIRRFKSGARRVTSLAGVYAIHNTVSGALYIGATINFNKRQANHCSELRAGTHRNKRLQRAWDKMGESAFKFVMLEVLDCPQHGAPSEYKQLCAAERKWQIYYVTNGARLYNPFPATYL